ncbi:MAG TPA: hypothetical protein VJ846_02910 [Sphingomicrobium sp.]|nr:hypothetical protein [Sphingomicrobium sp.]
MSEMVNGGVVAAFGLTHTPGLGDQMDRPQPAQVARVLAGFEVVRREIAEARPDVIVAFVNDHFDMYTLNAMPGFAIALGETHWGPTPETEAWIQMKRGPIPGNADLAHDIYGSLMEDGIELFRSESAELVHNVLIPKKYLWPDRDIPIVPIFTNCFIQPLPTFRRAYELGAAVRRVIDRRPERVAFMASGGISHWPPIVFDYEDDNDPLIARVKQFHIHGREVWKKDPTLAMDLLEREKEMAASEQELINVEWDKQVLDLLCRADVESLLAYDHARIREIGGPGASEMLMWVSVMAAMRDAPARLVMYEAVKEWMGGVGLISYADAIAEQRK